MEESKNSHKSPPPPNRGNERNWRAEFKQQIYLSNLAKALRRSSPITGKLVRQTADRVLAVEAKGKTRWSRSILSKRRIMKKLIGSKSSRSPAKINRKRKFLGMQRKVKILRRLVPGCRKISFPNLLEEATDYITALEMQVKAMKALADLLAGAQNDRIRNPNDSSSN